MTKKIDLLRNKVAEIGKSQAEYYRFFPAFAEELTCSLGVFLGDTTSVARCPAEGEFGFDKSYIHEGLGFEAGKYRIPLMIRLKNLNDDGEFLVRIRLYFTKHDNVLTAWVGDKKPVIFEQDKLDDLLNTTYDYLDNIFSSSAWFQSNQSDYQGTGMGFINTKNAMPDDKNIDQSSTSLG